MYFSCWSNSSFSALLLLPVFLFFSFCWSKYPVFYLFAPIQLASSFCLLEQRSSFQLFCSNPAYFSFFRLGATFLFSTLLLQSSLLLFFRLGATFLFSTLLLQSSLLLFSPAWSNVPHFDSFAPIQLTSLFSGLEQRSSFRLFFSNPARSSFLPVGANILFFCFSPQKNNSPSIRLQSNRKSISGCIQIICDPV